MTDFENSRVWFRNAGFGIMVHFGLYSVLEGEYRGRECNEWARHNMRISRDEYHRLASVFNPIYFDAEEWISHVKASGAKYFVITSKHHDGFALFDSKVSDFNVVRATPFGRDIIAELADACRRYGIRLGLYYSHDLDWEEPDAGGFIENPWWNPANNDWDFTPKNTLADFENYFRRKVVPQITELLTNYGELCQIWFDCPWTVTREQSRELRELVRTIQPGCLCGGRIGNGFEDIAGGADNCFDMDGHGTMPSETPVTLTGTGQWGFSTYSNMSYKSASELAAHRVRLGEKGVNLLLNVGPDHLGRFPGPAAKVLHELGDKYGF